jgi:hypothetical protein
VKDARKFSVRAGNQLTAEKGKRQLGVFDRQTPRSGRDYAMTAVQQWVFAGATIQGQL